MDISGATDAGAAEGEELARQVERLAAQVDRLECLDKRLAEAEGSMAALLFRLTGELPEADSASED